MTAVEADPATAIGPAFKAAMAAVRRLRGSERHHPEALRDAQYSLMFGLVGQEELSSSELAHLADVTPASATELLDELEAKELVGRRRSERDRRVVLVSLTARGQQLVDDHRRQVEPRWRAAFADFDDHELRTAAAVLDRMRAFFDELADERARSVTPS